MEKSSHYIRNHDNGRRKQEAGGVGEERDGHDECTDFAAMPMPR